MTHGKCWHRIGECLVWEGPMSRWDIEGAMHVLSSAGFIGDLKLPAVTKLLLIVSSCLFQWNMRKEKDFLCCAYGWNNLTDKYCFKDHLLTVLINITSITFHMRLLCINKMERKAIKPNNAFSNFYSYMQLLEVNGICPATKLHWSVPADMEASWSFPHFIKISAYEQ